MAIATKIGTGTQTAGLAEQLISGNADFRILAEAIAAAIFISRGKRLHYVNRAAESITGYTRQELLSMSFADLAHPDSRQLVGNCASGRPGDITHREIKILANGGEVRWLEITTATVELNGVPSDVVSAFDVTEHKKTEEELQLLSVTDPLTGLGNYRRLIDTLDAEIKRSGRTGRPFAVLLLDLNQLKKINDAYGHLTGSWALCRIADVLRVDCRAIDTATRYGGDEFAIILPETTATAARLAASRIHNRLAADSQQPALFVSIGVAVYPQDGRTIEVLLRAADRELYSMKPCEEKPSSLVCEGREVDGAGLEKVFI